MMISQPAWWCLEATWQRLLRRPADDAELHLEACGARPAPVTARTDDASAPGAIAIAAEPAQSGVESMVSSGAVAGGPLTPAERRARAAALRALALSRGRRFDAARAAFTDAARLDPELDLTRTPTFWKLERAAHEAAIDAYTAAGRDRDAAVLRARVRSTFRPKPLRTPRGAVLTP
jgi:hypothetical protein